MAGRRTWKVGEIWSWEPWKIGEMLACLECLLALSGEESCFLSHKTLSFLISLLSFHILESFHILLHTQKKAQKIRRPKNRLGGTTMGAPQNDYFSYIS